MALGLFVLVAQMAVPGSARARPGDLDPTFGDHGEVTVRGLPRDSGAGDMAVLSDDRIVAAGTARTKDPDAPVRPLLVRLMPDGALDRSFGQGGIVTAVPGRVTGPVDELAAYPDGQLLLAAGDFVARLRADGAPDGSFSDDGVARFPGGSVAAVAVASNGSVLIGGHGGGTGYVARLTASGELDPSFSQDGVQFLPQSAGEIGALAEDSVGRIAAVGGGFRPQISIVRLLPNGELDPSFSDDGIHPAPCPAACGDRSGQGVEIVALTGDRLLAFARVASWIHLTVRDVLIQVDEKGDLDPAFGGDGVADTFTGGLGSFAPDHAGRLVLAGRGSVGPPDRGGFEIGRLLGDGTLDPGFGSGGRSLVNPSDEYDAPSRVGVQSDGRIVAAGVSAGRLVVARFRVDPGVANVDADRLRDRGDKCPVIYGSHGTGCPASSPRLTLRRGSVEGERAYVGYIASNHPNCVYGTANPVIMKRRPGADAMIRRTEPTRHVDLPARPRYAAGFVLKRAVSRRAVYARVPREFQPEFGICRSARSPVLGSK